MAARHFGFALSNHFGPLKLLCTTSFAGTGSPITVAMRDGELSGIDVGHAPCLGRATATLFENTPRMPTLRDMHRIVAAHPTMQARLFLLVEGVRMTETLCAQDASVGELSLGDATNPMPARCTCFGATAHTTASLGSRTLPPP